MSIPYQPPARYYRAVRVPNGPAKFKQFAPAVEVAPEVERAQREHYARQGARAEFFALTLPRPDGLGGEIIDSRGNRIADQLSIRDAHKFGYSPVPLVPTEHYTRSGERVTVGIPADDRPAQRQLAGLPARTGGERPAERYARLAAERAADPVPEPPAAATEPQPEASEERVVEEVIRYCRQHHVSWDMGCLALGFDPGRPRD